MSVNRITVITGAQERLNQEAKANGGNDGHVIGSNVLKRAVSYLIIGNIFGNREHGTREFFGQVTPKRKPAA
jgi:hypothetical protein